MKVTARRAFGVVAVGASLVAFSYGLDWLGELLLKISMVA
jgi:hypothetical protein